MACFAKAQDESQENDTLENRDIRNSCGIECTKISRDVMCNMACIGDGCREMQASEEGAAGDG